MNIEITEWADLGAIEATREANDRFRTLLSGGALLLSAGIVGLGAANQARNIAAVRAFTDFDDDDLTDAHAIGDLDVVIEEPGIHRWRELIFFKIDAIGNELTLTIMLASEW